MYKQIIFPKMYITNSLKALMCIKHSNAAIIKWPITMTRLQKMKILKKIGH
jgi:hypothetical protein